MGKLIIHLTPEDAQVILNALGARPLAEVVNTFMNLRQQLAMAQGQQEAGMPKPNGSGQSLQPTET